ncbi:MAG: helix-turn-helix transcriptional regulator [Firmicutes bacterium]|nr:helix-turn-helix domain-containing protein [Bacillota bacterium]MDD7601316.1 helix-turn-helix transcriptional regulator [Bacillota bacterium]MDY5856495.1 helix-turn-helix transcriptional regulator [Anaerovoracaceae bacterium]
MKTRGKSTEILEKELQNYANLDGYFLENEEELAEDSLTAQLQSLLEARGMTRAQAVRESNLNEVYGYQILSGTRRPSRDKLLCFCFALKATVEETQNLLKRSGFAPLYARNRRDSVILFDLAHEKSLSEVNEDLYERGEPVLE